MTIVQKEWMKKYTRYIPLEELYARTGIQKAIFNTVYQLMAVKKKHPEYLGTGRDTASCTGLFPLSC